MTGVQTCALPISPEFVTPPFQTFLANAPRLHPRIYCFLDDRIGEARNRVTSHPEYAELQSRASQALKAEYTGMTDLYSRAEELRQHATYLYQAYHLTQKEIYAEKLRQLLEALIAAPPADGQLFASNFTASNIAWCLVAAYDLLYNNLSAFDRTAAENDYQRDGFPENRNLPCNSNVPHASSVLRQQYDRKQTSYYKADRRLQ